jgi:hypothetical protein
MDALLILGGLLLIVFGLVWLVTLAFGSSLFWGLGSLFPPLTLLYVVRHWRIARKAVVLGSLGFIPLGWYCWPITTRHACTPFSAYVGWSRPSRHRKSWPSIYAVSCMVKPSRRSRQS